MLAAARLPTCSRTAEMRRSDKLALSRGTRAPAVSFSRRASMAGRKTESSIAVRAGKITSASGDVGAGDDVGEEAGEGTGAGAGAGAGAALPLSPVAASFS